MPLSVINQFLVTMKQNVVASFHPLLVLRYIWTKSVTILLFKFFIIIVLIVLIIIIVVVIVIIIVFIIVYFFYF